MKMPNPFKTIAALFISTSVCAGVIQPGQSTFTSGTWEVTEDIVFTTPVIMESGAIFDIRDGVTVTFQDTFTACKEQVFSEDQHFPKHTH